MTTQLSLGVALQDNATFDNYYTEGQQAALHALQESAKGHAEQFLYCYGSVGVGLSHLLQACCHLVLDRTSLYLPLQNHPEFSPEILEGLEQLDLICLDDIDAVLGIREWEEALFHFYNRARDRGTHLIVSAKRPPQQLNTLLPDLKSRLSWGLVLNIHELSDAEKIRALQLRSHHRGLELSDESAKFLVNHYPRNMNALFEALDRLDKASLQAKRRLTIPFIKEIL